MKDFWKGFASIFGFYDRSEIEKMLNKTDEEALASDWSKVAKDMQAAVDKYK